MRSTFLLVPILLAGFAHAEDAGVQRATRVAVSSFDTSGVDERIATIFTNALLAELRKLQRVSVIGMDEVRAMLDLEAQKQLVGCEEESCLAEIAGALGADVLIIGGLASVNDQSILDLKRVDQRQAKVIGTVNQRLEPAGGEEFLAAIGPGVEQLFFDHELREGQTRGVAKEVALRLNPPPVPRAAFWTGGATTAGLALTSGVAALAWGLAAADYEATLENAALNSGEIQGSFLKGKERNVQSAEAITWTAVGLTTAAALVTAGMIPFVDWQDHAEE